METLTTQEQNELAECEKIISRNLQAFREAGNALLKVRDSKLYRASFETFEIYCRTKWGFSRQHASNLLNAAESVNVLSTMVDKLPETERQARPLAKLETPEEKVEAWNLAQSVAASENRPVKAVDVERAVETVAQPKTIRQQFAEAGVRPESFAWSKKESMAAIMQWAKRQADGRTIHELGELESIAKHVALFFRTEAMKLAEKEEQLTQTPAAA